jgi:hypothetical protein
MRHDHSRDNTSELAAGLQSLKSSPADAVVAMSHYPFSLAFYLGHSQPIRVVEDWGQSWVTQKDTWRRELFEAAEFAPDRGKRLLLTPDAMRLLLACSPRTVWLITSGLNAPTIPQLAGLERVAQVGNEIVWRKTPSSAAAPHPDCFP